MLFVGFHGTFKACSHMKKAPAEADALSDTKCHFNRRLGGLDG